MANVISIIALIISIISLVWQLYSWKQDREMQTKMAQYPQRLKFYTDFYDNLFRFINLKYSNSTGLSDLNDYCKIFNRFAEEAKILFNNNISQEVHKAYDLIKKLIDDTEIEPFISFDISNNNSTKKYNSNTLKQAFEQLQMDVKYLKLDTDLREKFIQVLKLEGNKDE